MLMWQILCGIFMAAAVLLLLWILRMKKAVEEICDGFADRLRTDTNTLIDVSCRDRSICRLASDINRQLALLRRQRQRYIQGDREVKDTMTNISHDLRTPLTAICGYLDLLKREELPPEAVRYLSQIENRSQVMKQLTEELLRYSVTASVPSGDCREELSLNSALEESMAAYYGAFRSRGIVPRITLPEMPVTRRLDRIALSRILSNIISNALKYSDGDFDVTLDPSGEITFSNTAASLDPVMAGRLFDRFFTVKTGRDATGLGLSIARLLTGNLGGEIGAEHREGKLFIKLSLPVRDD